MYCPGSSAKTSLQSSYPLSFAPSLVIGKLSIITPPSSWRLSSTKAISGVPRIKPPTGSWSDSPKDKAKKDLKEPSSP